MTLPVTAEYPPEPWHLGGSMLATLWRVDAGAVAAVTGDVVPADVRPLRVGGDALVFTAFVRYEAGSVLTYDELLVAVAGRRGLVPVASIPQIWVDSPASVAGGRALWGIPKGLATFAQTWSGPITARAAADGVPLANATARQGPRLPGWRRVPMPTAQHLDGATTFAEVQALARMHPARTRWEFPAVGPLAYLRGARQLGSAVLRDMAIRFGPSVRTVDRG
ncbi:acetoacetate decarboxylase family protein [Patulibacter sp. SYSU D01012]|uniref:acetoacetate decarboxylase family protein n=1 Tax=Patulibacter sp. SYSU D01012 TaxID=2817381 RepID=UPI001B31190E|nr:acetoacetate decarboxylase family protein [Patulibacter sp. SYSU D01012]